ncbi:MAG: hypothetical protein WA539_09610 [Candidatus Sulfotelmatobacter sp.]
MSVKKAKRKGKGRAKRSAKKSARKKPEKRSARTTKKRVDMVRVRENINNLVGNSARDIANEVIKVAKTGQLASAKYLFEAVGLYPPTEETAAKPDHSLAHTLLHRMGLPTEQLICDEDTPIAVVRSDAKTAAGIAEEDPESEPEPKPEPGAEKSEE